MIFYTSDYLHRPLIGPHYNNLYVVEQLQTSKFTVFHDETNVIDVVDGVIHHFYLENNREVLTNVDRCFFELRTKQRWMRRFRFNLFDYFHIFLEKYEDMFPKFTSVMDSNNWYAEDLAWRDCKQHLPELKAIIETSQRNENL